MKCAWSFLCDRCDHAGIWQIDIESMSFFIGDNISLAELESTFQDKINIISDDKIIIQAFIDFQYGSLNPENRVHQSVISRLEKLAPKKGLNSTLLGTKDKSKDKSKDLNIKREDKKFKNEIEKIYFDFYPLKKGKTKGVEKLSKEILTDADLENLKLAIERYSKTITDPKFTKHFATFASEWRDWLDQDAGQSAIQKNQDMDVSHIWGKK